MSFSLKYVREYSETISQMLLGSWTVLPTDWAGCTKTHLFLSCSGGMSCGNFLAGSDGSLALTDNEHWESILQGPMKSRSHLSESQGTFFSLLPEFHGSTWQKLKGHLYPSFQSSMALFDKSSRDICIPPSRVQWLYLTEAQGTFVSLLPEFHGSTWQKLKGHFSPSCQSSIALLDRSSRDILSLARVPWLYLTEAQGTFCLLPEFHGSTLQSQER